MGEDHTAPMPTAPRQMNTEQIRLAMALIAAMDRDPVARADANTYGNWFEHLTDHMADIAIEQGAPPVAC